MKTPKIVCLCGSTRFYGYFKRINHEETLKGNIVLAPGVFIHEKNDFEEEIEITEEEKIQLDELHKRKIDMANEVIIINPNNYIGDSTRSEIEYAEKHNKIIKYLE